MTIAITTAMAKTIMRVTTICEDHCDGLFWFGYAIPGTLICLVCKASGKENLKFELAIILNFDHNSELEFVSRMMTWQEESELEFGIKKYF